MIAVDCGEFAVTALNSAFMYCRQEEELDIPPTPSVVYCLTYAPPLHYIRPVVLEIRMTTTWS